MIVEAYQCKKQFKEGFDLSEDVIPAEMRLFLTGLFVCLHLCMAQGHRVRINVLGRYLLHVYKLTGREKLVQSISIIYQLCKTRQTQLCTL